jgi:hypothetical protein
MSTEIDELRGALKMAADRDSSAEATAVLEQMLERGMLRHCTDRSGRKYWSASGGSSMLDSIYAIRSVSDSLLLELFIEGKVGLRTNRNLGGPGIYWFPIHKVH